MTIQIQMQAGFASDHCIAHSTYIREVRVKNDWNFWQLFIRQCFFILEKISSFGSKLINYDSLLDMSVVLHLN